MDKGFILTIFSFLVCVLFVESQSTELKTTLSRSQITVGEKINLSVNANIPKNAKFTPPAPEDNFGKLTVKGWDLKRTELKDHDSVSVQYLITTFVPENCTIPALKFVIEDGLSIDTLYTENIPLEIISVINTQDSTIDIKDLRSQQNAGEAPLWWLLLIIFVVTILSLIFIVIFIGKRLRKPKKLPPPKPAYEEAIEALGILHGKRYLQQGLIREYVFELSEIFKRYIGRRFNVNAEEYTAEELIAWLGVSGLEMKIRHPVEWFFRTTDLVKFAKFTPDNPTVERFGKEVMDFLEITKPQMSETTDSHQSVDPSSENHKKVITSNTGEDS